MPDGIVAAIEPGESRGRVIVARYRSGSLRVLAQGEAEGEGIAGGHVTNVAAASRAFRAAVRMTERQLGYPLYSAVVCVPGAAIRSLNGQAAVEPSGLRRSVTARDANRVLARARPRLAEGNLRALHVLPMRYTVDGVVYDDCPLRVRGRELTVSTCALVAETALLRNLTDAVEAAGVHVSDFVAGPLSSSLATLSEAEQHMGVLLLEIGARTSTLAVVQRGCFLHAASIPVGGYHLTNDLAVALALPFEAAERLKVEQGALYLEGGASTLKVAGTQGAIVTVQRQEMIAFLRDRAQEILALAARRVQSAGWEHLPVGGVVLTGGSAHLSGMERLARELLHVPVRVGTPRGMEAMPAPLQDPAWAAPAGALLWKALCISGERSALAAAPALSGANPLSERIAGWASRIFESDVHPTSTEQQGAESGNATAGAAEKVVARRKGEEE
ncbi:MAG: cell division protein FtsA [Chloroflexi bacterium]|nr:cell division protein FtsA [Chloroflexota bacterium]